MFSPEEHLDDLVRHIERVRANCLLLGKRLMASGRVDFGRLLIAQGFIHDASKFHGIEWDYLHTGPDVAREPLELAIEQHRRTNPHHPEFWGGLEHMPEISVAEMVCDWYARAQEFGTDLREWIDTEAVPKYRIDTTGQQYQWIQGFLEVLLRSAFGRSASRD
jgi:hypothetical protein